MEEEDALQAFRKSRKLKDRASQQCFKKKKKEAKEETPVKISVGLMWERDGVLSPVRGKTFPVAVKPGVGVEELLQQALRDLKAFDWPVPSGPYVLLYPDGSKIEHIPGTNTLFNLKEYKVAVGKPYQRITVYICTTEDFRSYGEAKEVKTEDSGSEDSDVNVMTRSATDWNTAADMVSWKPALNSTTNDGQSTSTLTTPIETTSYRDCTLPTAEIKMSTVSQALLLEMQEREAESSQTLSDHTSATQLLRLQVEDLQKRLQEKDDKLSEAQQIIKGLRDEILALRMQLEIERRKFQETVQKQAKTPYSVQLTREDVDCKAPPPLSPTYTSDAIQTDQCGTDATEDQDRSNSLSITPEDCPVYSPVSQHSSPSSEHQHAAHSDSLHNDATSPQQRMSLRTLSVRLEDWGPKLNPDGVFLLPPVEHDDEDDDDDHDDINDDNDYIPDEAGDDDDDDVDDLNDDNDYIPDEADDENDDHHFGDNADSDDTPESQRTQQRPRLAARLQKPKRTPSKARVHECGTCGKRFAYRCLLRIHERVHTKEKPYPCHLCAKAFSQSSALKSHIKRHQGNEQPSETVTHRTKTRDPQCQECGKMFSGLASLKLHQRMHSGERAFSCKLCDKRYFSKSSLRNHENVIHTGVRPVMCSDCGQSFTSFSKLKIHMRRHTGEKPYQCTQCPKAFYCMSNLNSHLRYHTGQKPHVCAVCGKRFATNGTLRDHQRTHTDEKPFLCPTCGKTFRDSNGLRRHLRVHTGDRPFACPDCGQTFGRVSSLNRHRIKHTGNRSHLCAVCGKAFARTDDLKVHQRVHTGEKPFPCTICGERFSYVQTLQSHQKREHSREENENEKSHPESKNTTAGT